MKINALVYANCQSGPLANILASLCDSVSIVRLSPVHLLKPAQIGDVEQAFGKADVIVHQPIGPGFGVLSIADLKKKFPGKRFISFPSLYFLGYFPNLIYLRKPGGGTLAGMVGDYHDERVVKFFLRGAAAREAVDELDCNGPGDVHSMVKSMLESLRAKETGVDIQCTDFIAENFHREKLFYVMNHPSNRLLVHVAVRVLNLLNLKERPGAGESISNTKSFLSNYEVPIDRSIGEALGMDPSLRGIYSVRLSGIDTPMTVDEYVAGSYRAYEAAPRFEQLYQYTLERRKILD